MGALREPKETYCGRTFTGEDLNLIREMIADCMGLSRMELANTVCELLNWQRPTGKLKAKECFDFLEYLDEKGRIQLPEKMKSGRQKGYATRIPQTARGDERPPVIGTVKDFAPITLRVVKTEEQQLLWRELIGRHHYLGFKVPFGAHHRYLIEAARLEPTTVGCLQFSSPAWKMADRDDWIGWDADTRKRNLQRIVNNSRFLILPWVQIKNLASKALALAARQIAEDWQQRYNVAPVLLETLVDPARYSGTCYRAANWIHLGITTGRGRMNEHRDQPQPKELFVYPLEATFREQLLA